MRRSTRRGLVATIALGALAAPTISTNARAGWPPPESATAKDMADPSNWPNDPGYAFSDGSDGQWNFYSFIPNIVDPKMIEKSAMPPETASGMSIDLAWRYTIGDDSIRMAVTDSGIEWDSPDIIDKVAINLGEMQNHKPLHADGSACGGTGAIAGFDCNGDGIVSVSDWKDTPNLQPAASNGHPLGDKNNNGVFDAGDLILNYSDGVDDDGNGFVDDIAGWDFMKDDNDPYDDTRYGHGTGEANDSNAAANNMISGAGACPLCRFIPTRVGDSFIANVNAFGKAVAYATDNGATIIQCALGTINNNEFAQSAIDYAYDHGVFVITSMADENSRHHNMPAVSNHTVPVHAIEYDGSELQLSTTFVQYHPCSNFGGHNFLSASATACSSQATGMLSGISGLLFSAALKYNVTPKLTPAEAWSILFTTAFDINLPESQKPDSPYKWSQPGFDQRFGYGRVDANAAIEALKAGKIPPEVDITSPSWYSVLYPDQPNTMIPIQGMVAAKRATSFDWSAQWGPGVQPLDSEFKEFASDKNVPSSMTIGGKNGPIATLDVSKVDPTHKQDIDSFYGENDDAITVRVQAVAHYGGSIGDVKGELRRTYYVHKDSTLVKGFPIYLGASGESSPKMADIDGDGVRDLIVGTSDGQLHVYKFDSSGAKELPGFPFKTNPEDGLMNPPGLAGKPVYLNEPAYKSGELDPNLGREPIGMAPAIDDLDGDGKPEIVISTWNGTIYVVERDGSIRPGFPVRLPEVPSCPLDPSVPQNQPCMSETYRIARGAFAAPVLADMNKDGKLDIIQAAFDGKIYVFDSDGKPVDGWPVSIHYKGKLSSEPQFNRILTTPAVADFNGDGIPDLLVGSNERLGSGGQAGAGYLIDGRGNNAPQLVLPNWPVTMTSFNLFPLVAEGVPNAGIVGTIDGKQVAVMHGNASPPLIVPADPGKQTQLATTPPNAIPQVPDPNNPGKTRLGVAPTSAFGPLSKAAQPNTMLPLFAQPSMGDLDQDGVPDIVASGGSLNLAINLEQSGNTGLTGDNLLAMWSGKTGDMLPASPFLLEDFTFFNSQAIADLDGDGYPEVITGSGGYFIHAFDACGREPKDFPKFTGQWIIPTPAVGDLDGDHKLELAVGTRDGWLYVWHTDASDKNVIEWESFHHDNRNSGNLDQKLTQGGKSTAKKPLTAELCQELTSTSASSSSSGTGGSSSASSSSGGGAGGGTTSGGATPEGSGGCGCGVVGEGERGAFGLAALGVAIAMMRRRRRAA